MNILLDYFFPITSIEPTPQASTAFLKQVLVVGKPKDGGVDTGVITLCTLMSQVTAKFTTQGANEVQELFDAGMSRVYILPSDDLDLDTALAGFGDAYTLLVTSDFSDTDIASDITTPAVAAYLTTDDGGGPAVEQLTFTAKKAGLVGNDITIELVGDTGSGEEVAHAVDKAITVHIEDGVSTAQSIKDAIDDSVTASALVTVSINSGQETTAQAVFGPTNLDHGAQAIFTEGTGIQTGDFDGVIGYSDDDDAVLEDQAVISKRSAWHTTTSNKGANMFYAFGKFLSNSLDWLNQQYIEMPVADDVSTKGAADNLFDLRINFVLDDTQYGQRLGLFVAGGEAITAPYIKRNLEIDLQSAALSYISGNQPAYTHKNAALLEDELKKVIQSYKDRQWIEEGTIAITLEQDNFVASGQINIAEPGALWRIFANMRQTL